MNLIRLGRKLLNARKTKSSYLYFSLFCTYAYRAKWHPNLCTFVLEYVTEALNTLGEQKSVTYILFSIIYFRISGIKLLRYIIFWQYNRDNLVFLKKAKQVDILLFWLFYLSILELSWIIWWHNWCFRQRFCTSKAILGRGQPVLKR